LFNPSSSIILFTANFFQKIPSYIISRVLVNEFTEPDLELVVQRCQVILEAENVQYDIETVRSIVTTMYPDIRGIIGELQNSTSNGTLIKRKLYSTLDEAKAKLDLAINATTIDEAAAARLALRDVLPENLQAVDLALYVMNKYIDDALVHSIAYRYHIIAFRSFDQKHTVMAMLSDIELARFGYGM
jgi:DNA polymerase III delta prime subunit